MFHIKVKGLDALMGQLDGFSDRRMAAAMATALSRTASALREEYRRQMPLILDRPTPYTMNGLYVKPARATDLVAVVGFKDDSAVSRGGTPATKYLMPNVIGGSRALKRSEAVLRMAGYLPSGYVTVPGVGARLDEYGNMSRGQIVQILSQLRITPTAGYSRNMRFDKDSVKAQEKAGGRFFVIPPGRRAPPGVYQREFMGKNVTPVLMFVKPPTYRQRFDYGGIGTRFAAQRLPVEMARAVQEHVVRLAAKKG